MLAEGGEAHPAAFVTVKLYVPVARPLIVVVPVLPEIAPGLIVQLPEGTPFSTTEPVDKVHVGWVMVPTAGAATAGGCVTVTSEGAVMQVGVFASLAMTEYVPAV